MSRMTLSLFEKIYLGKDVVLELFDGTMLHGILHKTEENCFKDEPNLYYNPKYYVLANPQTGEYVNTIFKYSHIKRIELNYYKNIEVKFVDGTTVTQIEQDCFFKDMTLSYADDNGNLNLFISDYPDIEGYQIASIKEIGCTGLRNIEKMFEAILNGYMSCTNQEIEALMDEIHQECQKQESQLNLDEIL